MRLPAHGVVPGPAEMKAEPGMMAADCEKRRHLWQATSCMHCRVIYVRHVIYAKKRHL